jgi:hypothetical protein
MIRGVLWLYIMEIGMLLVVVVIGWIWVDKRYRLTAKDQNIPSEYNVTTERFVDPTSQKIYRVYYNPRTGERMYVEEL